MKNDVEVDEMTVATVSYEPVRNLDVDIIRIGTDIFLHCVIFVHASALESTVGVERRTRPSRTLRLQMRVPEEKRGKSIENEEFFPEVGESWRETNDNGHVFSHAIVPNAFESRV